MNMLTRTSPYTVAQFDALEIDQSQFFKIPDFSKHLYPEDQSFMSPAPTQLSVSTLWTEASVGAKGQPENQHKKFKELLQQALRENQNLAINARTLPNDLSLSAVKDMLSELLQNQPQSITPVQIRLTEFIETSKPGSLKSTSFAISSTLVTSFRKDGVTEIPSDGDRKNYSYAKYKEFLSNAQIQKIMESISKPQIREYELKQL